MRIYTDEITHHPEVEKRTHEVSIICTEAQQNNREEPCGSSRFSYPRRGGIKVNPNQQMNCEQGKINLALGDCRAYLLRVREHC